MMRVKGKETSTKPTLPNEAPNVRSKVILQGEPMLNVEVKPQVKDPHGGEKQQPGKLG